MGRLWQAVILINKYQVFEYLPFEKLIGEIQDDYYKSPSLSDKSGKSTPFIEYMPGVIEKSLAQLLNYKNRILKEIDSLEYLLVKDLRSSVERITRMYTKTFHLPLQVENLKKELS